MGKNVGSMAWKNAEFDFHGVEDFGEADNPEIPENPDFPAKGGAWKVRIKEKGAQNALGGGGRGREEERRPIQSVLAVCRVS